MIGIRIARNNIKSEEKITMPKCFLDLSVKLMAFNVGSNFMLLT